MNRRTFIKSSIAVPAAVGVLAGCEPETEPEAEAPETTATRSLERIGVQLYTVRHLLENDYEGTLRAVADAGYDEVETVWDAERNPDDIRALLDELGLAAPSTHVPIGVLKSDLASALDAAQRLGQSYIVCPWIAEDERTMAHYRDHVALFNEVGAACQEVGIQFAYHNHEFEFEPSEDGVIPYHFMLDEMDPDLVKMELDLYWVAYADRNISEYFQRDPGRYPLCHIKDMGPDRGMAPAGEGQIDFAAILAESETAGLRHYFVEHDHPEDAMASIRTSIAHLRSLTF